MNQYEVVMLKSLRDEILLFNAERVAIVVLVTAIAVALYIVGHRTELERSVRLLPIAIGSGLWGIGRTDLLMHRAARYIATLEANEARAWEPFKRGLVETRVLPLYDIVALGLWLYLLLWAWRRVATGPAPRRNRLFLAASGLFVLSGVWSILYAAQ